MNEMEKLSKIAETQPHAAYTAYTHGLSSEWNYLLKATDLEENQLDDVLASLEKSIQSCFIPALTVQPSPGEHTREMLALPARLDGLHESHYLSKGAMSCLTADHCTTC